MAAEGLTPLLQWAKNSSSAKSQCALLEKVTKSWDEAADRRLEKKLKIMQKESRKSKSPPEVPIVIQDDSLPSGPPPQIQILERMMTNSMLSNPSPASRPVLPVKSLAQREVEYMEARKQILGQQEPQRKAGETHSRYTNDDLPARRHQMTQ